MKKLNLISLIAVLLFASCISEESVETPTLVEESVEAEEAVEQGNTIADSSDIKCPKCGFETVEELPSDYCLLAYDCKACGETMHPASGDCCVFCTHGSEKCPSMQE